MASNHMIRFRVNKEQMERIRSDALENGYLTPSAYLRFLALKGNSVDLEVKVSGIAMDVKKIKEVVCNG
jgi:hypothetical protein